jgi:hypothetical protein
MTVMITSPTFPEKFADIVPLGVRITKASEAVLV